MWKRIAIIVAVTLLVALLAAGIFFWRYPLRVAAWTERSNLQKVGFRPIELRAASGMFIVWEKISSPESGEPLFLLHGLGDQAGVWSQVVRQLPANYHVLIPDFPGHGQSEPKEGTLTVGMMLDALDAVWQAKGAGRPAILVGNSMGAWVAMVYAFRNPERVARIVAVNGGAARHTNQKYSLTPKNREEASRLIAALRDPSTPAIPDFVLDAIVREANSGPIARLLASGSDLENYVLDGKLGELKTPVNLLWGGADKFMPLPYAGRLEFEIPAARLTILENCGHIPQRECPEKFVRELLKILSSPPPEPCAKCGAVPDAKQPPKKAQSPGVVRP
jgi:pimeloyl-ACP methyl ester carboxylesterase